MEQEILEAFSGFAVSDGMYTLYSDAEIYDFITTKILPLESRATLYYSERFKSLRVPEKVNIHANVRYNSDIDLLEAGFETDLSYEQICGILNAVKTKRKFYRLSNGRFLDLADSESRTVFNLLGQLDFTNSELKERGKLIPKYQALYLDAISGIDKEKSFIEYRRN
jgi:hypothetical protein